MFVSTSAPNGGVRKSAAFDAETRPIWVNSDEVESEGSRVNKPEGRSRRSYLIAASYIWRADEGAIGGATICGKIWTYYEFCSKNPDPVQIQPAFPR